MLFNYDIIFNWSCSCVYLCISYCPIMEEHLFLVQSNAVNIESVWYFTFTCPNSAIISDSCDCLGTQICILVEFSFPCVFKLLYMCAHQLRISCWFPLLIKSCLFFLIKCQFPSWRVFNIESRRNITCAGGYRIVVCTALCWDRS